MDAKDDEPKAEPDHTGKSLGEYVFSERLGRGGQGVVWLCEQPALERNLVVKLLAREGRGAQERFLREARLASRLVHPNAAHVYGSGFHEEFGLWIAMEHVAGVTLAAWLKANGRMTPEQFVPFFQAVVEVIAAAHAKGIIHRDLKAANIMVIEREGRLVPKLLDFGIAREDVYPATIPDEGPEFSQISLGDAPESVPDDATLVDVSTAPQAISKETEPQRGLAVVRAKRITGEGIDMGTQGYMAPEQWGNARAVDQAADIYATGVIAYECLRGRLPFIATTASELRAMHQLDRVPSLGPGFPREVDEVIWRALAKEPLSRYRTVTEFGAALCSALRALPQGQLQSLAQVWHDAGRPASLLLRGGDLLHARGLIGLPKDFVTESNKAAVLRRRRRLFLVVALAATVSAAGVTAVVSRLALKAERSEVKARVAEVVAETTVTQSELEQGRAELLHNEPGAASHLAKAYKRDPKPTTAFMLARALQSKLAERARFPSSFERTWSSAFSPDGKQVVTTDDKSAQIWDAQSFRLLFTLAHGDTVYQGMYSPEGSRVVTASGGGSVKLWDATNGRLVRDLRYGTRPVRYFSAAMSRDGKLVAAIDTTGAFVHIWNLETGVALTELRDRAADAPAIAFSSDAHWLAISGGSDVRVFDTHTWRQVLLIESAHRLAWDPGTAHLVTGGYEGDVSLWDIPNSKRLRRLRDVGEPVDAVAFSPNGRMIVAATRDGTEQVWGVGSGKRLSQCNYLHGKIMSIEFDPSSTLLVAAGVGGYVAVTSSETGTPVFVMEGSSAAMMTAHFAPTSQQVIGASFDGAARIWDITAPYRRWSSPRLANSCRTIPSHEPDSRLLLVSCENRPTRIVDTERDLLVAELPSVTSEDDSAAPAPSAISSAGDRAAVARGSSVGIYEIPSGRLLRTIRHDARVSALAFASTGRDLISGAANGSLLVSHDDGVQLVFPVSSAGIDAVGFLSDGRLIASDAQRRLRVYDASGTRLAEVETSARVLEFRASQDGRRLVTLAPFADQLAAPELWDLVSYHSISQLADKGQGRVFFVRFVAGGRVLTACGDGRARLWDSTDGQLRKTYRGGSRYLADATISADGSMVVAGDGEGVLRFWDTLSGAPLWIMPAHGSPLVGIRIAGDDIITRGLSGDVARWTLARPERVIEACGNHKLCGTVFP